jgi:hypothetical protein
VGERSPSRTVDQPNQHTVAPVNATVCDQWREGFSLSSGRRLGKRTAASRVDQKSQHTVAQVNFTVCELRREGFIPSSVRPRSEKTLTQRHGEQKAHKGNSKFPFILNYFHKKTPYGFLYLNKPI